MSKPITWVVPETDDALYTRYAGQSERQPVRLCLDLETGVVTCEVWANIGPGQSMRSFHGVDLEWDIPPLRRDAVGRLYTRIANDVRAILDGAEIDWDGRNWVGKLSEGAEQAREAIEQYVETGWEASDCWEPWDASDYFEPVTLRDIGLTAESTEEEIRAKAAHEAAVADVVLDEDDVYEHLCRMVEDARDELEDESC